MAVNYNNGQNEVNCTFAYWSWVNDVQKRDEAIISCRE